MKYEEFYARYLGEILHEKPTYIRKGQALMNFLLDIWPEEYRRIIGNNESVDCFYDDNLISKTLSHLEKIWNKKDEETKTNHFY
jgi:hypothetical protein